MRILFLILTFLPLCSFAQIDSGKVNHTIGFVPISLYPLQFSLAHGINYKIDFYKNYIELSSEGTLFNKFDSRKRNGGNLEKLIPFLNYSTITYGREFFSINEKSENKLNFLIGYNYFQHGSKPWTWGYWDIDSLSNGGVQTITGFQTHIASFGFSCSNIKFSNANDAKRYPKVKNTIECDYLLGLAIRINGVNNYPLHQESVQITNVFPFMRHGVRFQYKFEYFFKPYFGIYSELDVLFVPFIDYTPNYEIFVPRGGEGVFPFFPSLKVGVNFCF